MLITENRISQAKEKYTAFIEKNAKLFEDLVATPFMVETNHKYLDWLVSVLQKEKTDLPFREIINILTKFNKVASHLDRKNIYSYTDLLDVQHAVAAHIAKEARSEGLQKETEVVFDTNDYLLVRVYTLAAVRQIGKIMWTNEGSLQQAIDDGILLVLLNKKSRDISYYAFDNLVANFSKPKIYGWIGDLPSFVNDRIRLYIQKQPTAHKYLSPREFNEQLDLAIVQQYPRSFECQGREINCSYREEGKGVMLVYEIDAYNAILNVSCDLFDPQYPVTVHMQDATAKSAQREKTIRIAYKHTAFIRRDFFQYLSANTNQDAAMDKTIRLLEMTICTFIRSHDFLHIFDENKVYLSGEFADIQIGNRRASTSLKFLEYVAQQQKKDKPATRRDFFERFLKKDMSKLKVRGNNNTMFRDLQDAGIIEYKKTPIGYTYVLGPNHKAYMEGRLRAGRDYSNPWVK